MLGDAEYIIIKNEDEEESTPSDPTERVIAQVFRILGRYKKENKDNPSSWINEVLTQETLFIGYIGDSKHNAVYFGKPALTVLDIQKYVLTIMAPTFTSSIARLVGSPGNSKLRIELETTAKSWTIENVSEKKLNKNGQIKCK